MMGYLCATFLSHKHCYLDTIKVATRQMGMEAALALAKGIKKNPNLANVWVESVVPVRAIREQAIITLDWQEKQINCRDMVILGYQLQWNTSLIVLNLSENRIEREGVAAFVNLCGNHPNLQILDMSLNPLRDGVGNIFAKYLEIAPRLEILHLRGCILGDNFVSTVHDGIVKNTRLRQLHLQTNDITDCGVEEFEDIFTDRAAVRQTKAKEFAAMKKHGKKVDIAEHHKYLTDRLEWIYLASNTKISNELMRSYNVKHADSPNMRRLNFAGK